MNKLVLSISLLLGFIVSSAQASEFKLYCVYDGGGYDDEEIVANLENGKVTSLSYESFQGEVGPFKKIGKNSFYHSTNELIIEYKIYFSDSLGMAFLTTSYKNDEEILHITEFDCKKN